jgi:uncharacterized protein YjiS (DUF1127 family)
MSTQLAERSILSSVGRSAGESILPDTQAIFIRPLRTVAAWFVRSSQRRALHELAHDGHLLSDIGLTRDEALREAVKPFWRR